MRFWLDKDLRYELATRLKGVRLISDYESSGVTRPARRRALKLCMPTREWQRYLNRVVSVYSSRFSRQTNPQTTPTPKQNTPGCRRLHWIPAAARVCPLLSNQTEYAAPATSG
jgi:hypothetical protein